MKAIIVLTFLMHNFSYGQKASSVPNQAKPKGNGEFNNSKISTALKSRTEIKNPFEVRDPFRPSIKKIKKKKATGSGKLKKVDYSQININDLKVSGVLVGKQKRAFAVYRGSPLILKEGDKFGAGKEKTTLKAILPGGLVLVEKFINIYGQDEYLETIIPISGEDGDS